jgi:tetratricopeptide (TPR) repeat protein
MQEIFPEDHLEKLKRPFEKEWEKLESQAKACRDGGGTVTVVVDEYDLLSVGHFFNIFDSYFDKFFSSKVLAEKDYVKPVKTKLLGNLKGIKDYRDPLSHPVTEEISYEEAFGILTDAKQVLSSLGFQGDANEISNLITQLTGFDSHEASEIICRLPTQDSIYLEFVGRHGVLESLANWFAQPTNKRCLLAGDGGKGKSAVAYKFAQNLCQSTRDFKLIAWLSAKRRKFEGGKVVPIEEPDFSNLETAIDRLLFHYGSLPTDVSTLADKRSKLFQLLQDYPAFLVIDDIDSVLEDTEVVSLFTFEIPTTKSVVLLTSRREIPGIKKFDITGFELPETEEFVMSRIELYGLDPRTFPQNIAKEINEVTDGSPLYMDDLFRLARIVPIKHAIKIWSEKQGDEARKYALQRELEQLSLDARKVLLAASIDDGAISFAELQSILAYSEDRILVALSELQTLFLLPKPQLVEGEQRFELNSNTRKLVRFVEAGTDQYARLEAKVKAIHGTLPRVGGAIVSALIRQAFLLLEAGKSQDAESLMLQAVEKYPQEADLEGFVGYLYRRLNRFADAEQHFDNAYKLKSVNRDTYRHWVKMEMSRKEWTKAISAADKALRMIPGFYELEAIRADARMRSALDLSARLQREKAFKIWSETISDITKILKAPDKLHQGERTTNAQYLPKFGW